MKRKRKKQMNNRPVVKATKNDNNNQGQHFVPRRDMKPGKELADLTRGDRLRGEGIGCWARLETAGWGTASSAPT